MASKLPLVWTLCLLVSVFAHIGTSSLDDDINGKMQAFLDSYGKSEFFSAVQASYLPHGEETAFQYHAGTKALDSQELIDDETMFGWGSITKEFTTSLLMNLQSQGILTMESTLGEVLDEKFVISDNSQQSEWPQDWKTITLVQVLNMTSGIPSYGDALKSLMAHGDVSNDPVKVWSFAWSSDELVGACVKFWREYPAECQPTGACYPPGTKYHYSNTDYIIAGMIASKYNGSIAVEKLFNEEILGHTLPNEVFYADAVLPDEVLSKMPRSYTNSLDPTKATDVTDFPWYAVGAAGGLIGTTRSLVHLIANFWKGQIVDSHSMDQFYSDYFVSTVTSLPVTDFRTNCPKGCYGLGVIALSSDDFGTVYFYRGQPFGFRTAYLYSPCYDFAIGLTINSANVNGTEITTNTALDIMNSIRSARPDYFQAIGHSEYCPQSDLGSDDSFLPYEIIEF